MGSPARYYRRSPGAQGRRRPGSKGAALAEVPLRPPAGPGLTVHARARGPEAGSPAPASSHAWPRPYPAPRSAEAALAPPTEGAGTRATPAANGRPPEAHGWLRGSPASACGAPCKRGVLSDTFSPSGDWPGTGDLMTSPGSRWPIYRLRVALRPDSRTPEQPPAWQRPSASSGRLAPARRRPR